MKLTRIERLVLANQYKILEALYPEEADYYKEAREIVEHGFELQYSWISENVYDDKDTLSSEECKEVIDILEMFDNLRYSYEQLKDKDGIEEHSIKFQGFDGNDNLEGKYMSYARFFCESGGGRFEKISKGDFYNSHSLSLDMYRRMLGEYRKSKKKSELTKEEILNIIGEKVHPSRR